MTTAIYIWFRDNEGEEDFDPSDVEEALRGLPRSAVRLTGAGGGDGGFNFDLALADGQDLESWVARLVTLLRQQGVSPSTYFEVYPSGWKPGMPHRRVEVFGEDRWLTAQEP
jgi:hypothetical protein